MKAYIAGPYSNDPERGLIAAIEVAELLHNKGYTPFIPHLYHLWHNRHPHTWWEWMMIDLQWLDDCDILFRIPGPSAGADIEEVCARALSIPVFTNIDSVPNLR